MSLVQEHPEIACDPVRILVLSMLRTKATEQVALEVTLRLFRLWTTVDALAQAHQNAVERVLAPLGLQRTRAKKLRALARAYVKLREDRAVRWGAAGTLPTRAEIEKLAGVSKSAADAWSLLVEGDLTVVPTDEGLVAWLDARMGPGEVGFD